MLAGEEFKEDIEVTDHDHADEEVGPELEVGPGGRRQVRVLVDGAPVDELGPRLALRVRRLADVEVSLEVGVDALVPFLECPARLRACTFSMLFLLFCQFFSSILFY